MKSKIIALFTVMVLVLSLCPAIYAEELFSGGTGTADDPFQISTKEDLNDIRNFLGSSVYFIQTADISFGTDEYFMPIEDADHLPFKGKYDGNGYKIKNLKIQIDRTKGFAIPFIGLFTTTENATLTNIALENISYNTIGDPLSSFGGLVGWAENGSISNCFAAGSITQTATEDGYGYYGGLVGFSEKAVISNSYAWVDISTDDANATIGGFIGNNNGTIENCYSAGEISAVNADEYYVGGFAGSSFLEDLTNCYYDSEICSLYDGRGFGYPTVDMKKQTTYQGWNFETVWQIADSISYPTLQNGVSFLDATVDKDILKLYFSEKLKYYSRPLPENFTVNIGDANVTVKSVAINDNIIILTLNSAVNPRQDGYVSYDFTGRNITDMAGDKSVEEIATRQIRNLTFSANANLASISVSGVDLNEAFSPNVTYYTAEVDNDVTEISISATTEDIGTQYRLCNAWEVPLENEMVPLYLGSNTFRLHVYSEGGLAEKWYTVVITRKRAIVSVDDADIQFEYTRNTNTEPEIVTLDTSSIPAGMKFHVGKSADWIIATPDMAFAGDEISVSFDPTFLASSVYNGNIQVYDANIETVIIPIVLNVYNNPTAALDSLIIQDVELTQTGDTFFGIAAEGLPYIDIQASALYGGSIVGNGEQQLVDGMNHFIITAVSEDGEATRDYAVDIYRDYPNLLDLIEVTGGTLAPEFAAGVYNYVFTVTNTENLSIYAETNDEYSDIYWEGDVEVEYVDGHEGDINYVTNVTITGDNIILRVINRLTGKEQNYNVTIEGIDFTESSHSGSISRSSSGGSGNIATYSIGTPPVVKQGSTLWIYSAFAKLLNGKSSVNWKYDVAFSNPEVLSMSGDNIVAGEAGICEVTLTDKSTNKKLTTTLLVEAELKADETQFIDIDDHWAKEYIAKSAKLGIMKGVGDNRFDPNGIVTVEEAIAVLDRILIQQDKIPYSITDAQFKSSDWSELYIKDFLGKINIDKLGTTVYTEELRREQTAYLIASVLFSGEEDEKIESPKLSI